jgi:hypothetical protein
MTLKFDIHLNVGRMFRTKKSNSLEMFYTGKEVADFCNFYGITHTVCIYDEYKHLKELIDNAPNTKVYGVQWIVDLENQELDIGKEGWYGIKLHSHRGFRDSRLYDRCKPSRKATEEEWLKAPVSYGLDYADPYIKTVLDRLPDDSLVYMHTQGGASLKNRARPEHIFMLATEYRNLKFIMGHAGNYGGMTASMPSLANGIPADHISPASKDKFRGPIQNFVDGFSSVAAAVIYANATHNIFLDSSCYFDGKSALGDTKRWAVGSDYPFGNNKRSAGSNGNDETIHFNTSHFSKGGYIWNYDKQVELFENVISPTKVAATHQCALDFIETSAVDLAAQQVAVWDNYKELLKSTKEHMKHVRKKIKDATN